MDAIERTTKAVKITTDMTYVDMTTMSEKSGPSTKIPVNFTTNCCFLATEMRQECRRRTRARSWLRHAPRIGSRTRVCQIYPDSLCSAIRKGARRRNQAHEKGLHLLGSIDSSEADAARRGVATMMKELNMVNAVESSESNMVPPEETVEATWANYINDEAEYVDNVTGYKLITSEVDKARATEMTYIRKMNLWTVVPKEDCYKATGHAPIKGRWVDIHKGDDNNRRYRSRYVAKEFRRGGSTTTAEVFAATPPLEALRILLSMAATRPAGHANKEMHKVMVMDVSRAYFYAPAIRPLYVELPAEEGVDTSMFCAKLKYSLPGTRDAAHNWAKAYGSHLKSLGFSQGRANPCLYFHAGRQLRLLVHGDDYMVTGGGKDLRWLRKEVGKKFEVKASILGPEEDEVEEVTILGRVVRWTDQGLEYEADPRHAEIIVNELSLKGANGVGTPGTKLPDTPNDETPLSPIDTTSYRAISARINYLAQDRFDLGYSAKECARHMSQPCVKHKLQLKRVGRYLIRRPRVVVRFPWQDSIEDVTGHASKNWPMEQLCGYTDSDWAGCPKSRRSTSAGVIMLGQHTVKAWSRTQALVALSSAEAELYATVKASAESIGIQAILKDWGVNARADILGDASACLALIHRRGLGKARHIDTKFLWVQDKAASNELRFRKVLGKDNPADLLTKYLDQDSIERHMNYVNCFFVEGRASSAPQVCSEGVSLAGMQRIVSHLAVRSEGGSECMHP